MILISKGDITLEIEEPGAGYNSSRFDWTGKIVQMYWKNIPFCAEEVPGGSILNMGRGFFNEFGIDCAVGYDDTAVGDYYPKIGVGSLLKESHDAYDFFTPYKYEKFRFSVRTEKSRVVITCLNDRGIYPFILKKDIEVTESGFKITYDLENKSELPIETTEYVHNFLSPGSRPLGRETILSFNNIIDPGQFHIGLNPDNTVEYNKRSIRWKQTPQDDFFFERITVPEANDTAWTLKDDILSLSISEAVDFEPVKINLWGRAHVVSPEVFKKINLKSESFDHWSRIYTIF